MKKDQYFNLEVNLLNDDNIASMMSEMNAAEALGIYVILLLHLRTKDAYEASCKPVLLKAMARRYDVDVVAVERVLREFTAVTGVQTCALPIFIQVRGTTDVSFFLLG